MDSHPEIGLADFYHRTLMEDVLPFWFPRCVDSEHGGFLHCLNRDGAVVDTDKSVWAQGRMSWLLLTLYNQHDPRPEWLTWAESGLEFLARHAFDPEGRMYFHLDREGRPIRQRRYAFSECFAAIAWGAHARATGRESSADRARDLFERFVDWNFTPGRMPSKFADTRPQLGLAPRMMTLVTARELIGDLGVTPEWTSWSDRMLEEIEGRFLKPELEALMETVGPGGEVLDHFDGRTLNPGHGLEAAWFVLREAECRGDSRLLKMGCDMLDWSWRRGWDVEEGGLLYFVDLKGGPVQEYWHEMKFWWPHCEAILATLMAGRLTGETRYVEWHRLVHDWSFSHFPDPEHGEWFGYLRRDGTPCSTLKGNLWKSAFHLPRMLLSAGRQASTFI